MAVAELGETVLARVARFCKREAVLVVAWVLAILSMFFVPPSVEYVKYLDFKVLGCLFALMVVVAAFRRIRLFDLLAFRLLQKVTTNRQVAAVLVGITFFLAMLVTNDVALITFVPFAIIVYSMVGDLRPILPTVVLQTVAANIGSSLTPMGNPQNLYIYSFYGMDSATFFTTMLPLVAVGAVALAASLVLIPANRQRFSLAMQEPPRVAPGQAVRYVVLFLCALAAVFNVIAWYVSVLVVVAFSRKDVLKELDYPLLLTFVGFFVFVGNLGNMESVATFLKRLLEGRVFLTSLAASQVISNVPATLLLSHFTAEAGQLLLGVNAGGCGTLIASLASVISFKIHASHAPGQSGRYMVVFTAVNVTFVALFIATWAVFLR